jgi:hypothetical protein
MNVEMLEEAIGSYVSGWEVKSIVMGANGPIGVLGQCPKCKGCKTISRTLLKRKNVPACVRCKVKKAPRKRGRKKINVEKEYPQEYRTWKSIKTNACTTWRKSFRRFYADTGVKPENTRATRPNRYKPYSPKNFEYKPIGE